MSQLFLSAQERRLPPQLSTTKKDLFDVDHRRMNVASFADDHIDHHSCTFHIRQVLPLATGIDPISLVHSLSPQ